MIPLAKKFSPKVAGIWAYESIIINCGVPHLQGAHPQLAVHAPRRRRAAVRSRFGWLVGEAFGVFDDLASLSHFEHNVDYHIKADSATGRMQGVHKPYKATQQAQTKTSPDEQRREAGGSSKEVERKDAQVCMKSGKKAKRASGARHDQQALYSVVHGWREVDGWMEGGREGG